MAKKDKSIDVGDLGEYPNIQYKKLFEKFLEIETLDVEEWKTAHILGYFIKKYFDTYQVKYQLKFNSPSPAKSFEIFQIKRLALLLSSSPTILKSYIDWIYSEKVTKAKRRLTSISFMTNEGIVAEYKHNVLFAGKKNLNVSRSTELPEKYRLVFQEAGVTIKTYGELSFISQMDSMSPQLSLAFQQVEEMGFDKEVLKRIV